MQARVLSLRVMPEKLEEVLSAYRDFFVPELEQLQGFSTLLLLRDAKTGKTLELILFDSEDARRESEREGGVLDRKVDTLTSTLGESPTIENYELWLVS